MATGTVGPTQHTGDNTRASVQEPVPAEDQKYDEEASPSPSPSPSPSV